MATQPDWLTFDVAYEPDPEAEVTALVSMVEYSRAHRLAERYPTPEAVEVALIESEAHARDCLTCRLDGQESCPDGRRYLERYELALAEHTTTNGGDASQGTDRRLEPVTAEQSTSERADSQRHCRSGLGTPDRPALDSTTSPAPQRAYPLSGSGATNDGQEKARQRD